MRLKTGLYIQSVASGKQFGFRHFMGFAAGDHMELELSDAVANWTIFPEVAD